MTPQDRTPAHQSPLRARGSIHVDGVLFPSDPCARRDLAATQGNNDPMRQAEAEHLGELLDRLEEGGRLQIVRASQDWLVNIETFDGQRGNGSGHTMIHALEQAFRNAGWSLEEAG